MKVTHEDAEVLQSLLVRLKSGRRRTHLEYLLARVRAALRESSPHCSHGFQIFADSLSFHNDA
jgi:hypothetical protein